MSAPSSVPDISAEMRRLMDEAKYAAIRYSSGLGKVHSENHRLNDALQKADSELEAKIASLESSLLEARRDSQRLDAALLDAGAKLCDLEVWHQIANDYRAAASMYAKECADRRSRIASLEKEAVDARRMVAVWKATIEMDARDIERAAVELDVYEFRTFALSIARRWLGMKE